MWRVNEYRYWEAQRELLPQAQSCWEVERQRQAQKEFSIIDSLEYRFVEVISSA